MATTDARITRDDKRKWNKLAKQLQEIKRTEGKSVKIGVFAEQGSDLVKYAGANEFGATIKRARTTIKIPERSFLRAAIDEGRQEIVRFVDLQAINLLIKQNQSLKRTLRLLGLFGVKLVKAKIIKGPFVPNAPATIRKKGSSKPLIDKTRLFGSITFKT